MDQKPLALFTMKNTNYLYLGQTFYSQFYIVGLWYKNQWISEIFIGTSEILRVGLSRTLVNSVWVWIKVLFTINLIINYTEREDRIRIKISRRFNANKSLPTYIPNQFSLNEIHKIFELNRYYSYMNNWILLL